MRLIHAKRRIKAGSQRQKAHPAAAFKKAAKTDQADDEGHKPCAEKSFQRPAKPIRYHLDFNHEVYRPGHSRIQRSLRTPMSERVLEVNYHRQDRDHDAPV